MKLGGFLTFPWFRQVACLLGMASAGCDLLAGDVAPLERCGDGVADYDGGEECDDGKAVSECRTGEPGCYRPSYCGDGIVDASNQEECDDRSDSCVDCRIEVKLALPVGKTVFVTKSLPGESDFDLDYLAAIPAATALTRGKPAVLAVEAASDLLDKPWVANYLDRYRPEQAVVLGLDLGTIAHASRVKRVKVAPPGPATSMALAEMVWTTSSKAVVCAADDFPSAVIASALAARLRAPLLFAASEPSAALNDTLLKLQVQNALVVGGARDLVVPSETLADEDAVLQWLLRHGLPIEYIAAVNPEDRASSLAGTEKTSMLAPLLAGVRRGAVVTLRDVSSHASVKSDLKDHYSKLGATFHPEYLALVGTTTFIPYGEVDNPLDWPETPVLKTDATYANVDDDPFLEIAVGRVIAQDLAAGSLWASRVATYQEMFNGDWERKFVETGMWGAVELRPTLENAGFVAEDRSSTNQSNAPPIEAGVLLHDDHSAWWTLGNAFDMNTETLLSPAVVVSRGCATAGFDQDESQSIVKRLFRQGAVAHMGGPRNVIAMSSQMSSATFNAILDGASLGHAYRKAFEAVTLNELDGDRPSTSNHGRYNWALIGDPAFMVHTPASLAQRPASAEIAADGLTMAVSGPAVWWEMPLPRTLLDEWKWSNDLFVPVGAGTAPLGEWTAAGYDIRIPYFVAAFRTDKTVTDISQEVGVPAPLGWGGSFATSVHVDSHLDGSRTYLWRVRLIDYNQESGSFLSQIGAIRYSLKVEP